MNAVLKSNRGVRSDLSHPDARAIRLALPEAAQAEALVANETSSFGMIVPLPVAGQITIPLRPLGIPRAELWRSPADTHRLEGPESAFLSSDGELLFGVLRAGGDDDLTETAGKIYQSLLDLIERHDYPHLVRIWNYFPRINEVEAIERYQSFCMARYDAFERRGYTMSGDLPAGSAVGSHGGDLVVIFLASRTRPRYVENPRQISAFCYPKRYGPRSPSFARAALLADERTLFISGTASIVGHETLHEGDVVAQTDETLRNLDAVVKQTWGPEVDLGSPELETWLKVYVRNAEDQPRIAGKLANAAPADHISWLEADICRENLLVEIEAFVVRS